MPETRLYYNIDYETWDAPRDDLGRFHASWRRENPRRHLRDARDGRPHLSARDEFSDAGNYMILEAQGSGQFIGCNLNIHAMRLPKGHDNWYGEGDEMIFVDDDNEGVRWPPTLHGTGTEDYFNTAWAPAPFLLALFGLPQPGGAIFRPNLWYRWHIPDPVRFTRRSEFRSSTATPTAADDFSARLTGTSLNLISLLKSCQWNSAFPGQTSRNSRRIMRMKLNV